MSPLTQSKRDTLPPPARHESGDDATLPQRGHEIDRAAELSRPRARPPAEVPGYAIARCLGEGAYGSVWLAREQNTGKRVAIKFYTHRRGLDWSLLNREVEKLAVLYTSRHIVGLLEVGWDSDPPHYVMEYLENGSLASFLSEGPLPPCEAVRIARSVLHALVHAHGSGILHCDLKPANVLLDADFEPRICDFGQSRLSDEQNPALGTLFYMAPEQADLKAVPDARWDVYAIGALLYQMLCGEAPYRTAENEQRIRAADSLEEKLAVYRQILHESPRPSLHRGMPGVDKRLADIVERCLRVDPHKRFPNAQAVLDALELRDRQRARRPLLALGLVGPALLLLAMAVVARQAMRNTVEQARDNQITRALDSDALSADAIARSLERDLEDRTSELVRIARDISSNARLRKAIESSADHDRDQLAGMPAAIGGVGDARAEWHPLLELKTRFDDSRRALGRPEDTSWFVTDRRGVQIWREPYDDTVGKPFHWREYFNGERQFDQTVSYERIKAALRREPIIDRPHVSLPFVSQATGQYMVAISVPVFGGDDGETVIGVMARTTDLGELLEEYGRDISGQARGPRPAEPDRDGHKVDRVTALIAPSEQNRFEGRWILLDHPWLKRSETKARLRSILETSREHAILKQGFDELLTFEKHDGFPEGDGQGGASRNYADPAARNDPEYAGVWLAAFSPVKETGGWTVVVQESRSEALGPVDEMERQLLEYGVWALLVFLAVIGLVWLFVWRALNDRTLRISTPRNGSSSPSNGSASD